MIHQSYSLKTNNLVKAQLLAEVEFGVPSKECRSFGICKIYPLGRFEHIGQDWVKNREMRFNSQTSVGAIVSLLEDNHVEISFLKHYINLTDKHKYFMGNKFKVEENFCFILQDDPRLEIKIKKGEYPVDSTNTFITVTFDR